MEMFTRRTVLGGLLATIAFCILMISSQPLGA